MSCCSVLSLSLFLFLYITRFPPYSDLSLSPCSCAHVLMCCVSCFIYGCTMCPSLPMCPSLVCIPSTPGVHLQCPRVLPSEPHIHSSILPNTPIPLLRRRIRRSVRPRELREHAPIRCHNTRCCVPTATGCVGSYCGGGYSVCSHDARGRMVPQQRAVRPCRLLPWEYHARQVHAASWGRQLVGYAFAIPSSVRGAVEAEQGYEGGCCSGV